jgi:methyl-accepting chemotaxis protein
MKLSVKIPLLLGMVVFASTVAMLVVVGFKVRDTIEKSSLDALVGEIGANADFLKSKLDLHLGVLGEVAGRARTRTMDPNTVPTTLKPDVERLNALDLAMVTPEGTSYFVRGNSTDIKDHSYFKRAMKGERNIEMAVIDGQLIAIFALPIRKNDEADAPVIGVLLAHKDGAHTLSNLVAELKTPYESGYAFLLNEEGTVIAHRNQDFINNQFNPIREAEKDSSLRPLVGMITAAYKEKNGKTEYYYEGKDLIGAYSKVPGFNWMLFLTIEKSEIEDKLSQISIVIILIGIICLIIGVAVAVGVGRSIAKPVISMVEASKDITQGEGDLSQSIPEHFQGEMGDLARYFNKLIATLRLPISEAKAAVEHLVSISEELSSINRQLEIQLETSQATEESSQEIIRIGHCVQDLAATTGQLRQTMDKFKV